MAPVEDIPRFRRDPEGVWAEKLAEDPDLAQRIEGATNKSKLLSTTDLSAFYRASSGSGWALVGDAGHFKDPVVGQGQRDALRHGRLLGEAAQQTLDDTAALDRALQAWERGRDRDTISTYHWGNRETRAAAPSALIREVFRGFAGGEDPDVTDTFNRIRRVERVVGPGRMVKALARVLTTPGADRRAILREVAEEIPIEIGIRREWWFGGFRYAGRSASEHPGWELGAAPRTRRAVVAPRPGDSAVPAPTADQNPASRDVMIRGNLGPDIAGPNPLR